MRLAAMMEWQMDGGQELPERESMEFDVVIVGAGPAGLAAAIRLKQLDPERSVVVLEKACGSRRAHPFGRGGGPHRHQPPDPRLEGG